MSVDEDEATENPFGYVPLKKKRKGSSSCIQNKAKSKDKKSSNSEVRKFAIPNTSSIVTAKKSSSPAKLLEDNVESEGSREGLFCCFCQMPLTLLSVKVSADAHALTCSTICFEKLPPCKLKEDCDITIPNHFSTFNHIYLASLRSGLLPRDTDDSQGDKVSSENPVTEKDGFKFNEDDDIFENLIDKHLSQKEMEKSNEIQNSSSVTFTRNLTTELQGIKRFKEPKGLGNSSQTGLSVKIPREEAKLKFQEIFKSSRATSCKQTVKEKQEASTSKDSKLQTSPCPFYKRIANTNFVVDAFNYGNIPGVSKYFLSHFHYDHYIGLNKSFKHTVVCSEITARLLLLRIRLPKERILCVPTNESVIIEGIEVTLLDANHCPGAVMFLFRLQSGQTILHCGDFRAVPSMESNPKLSQLAIDKVYLDTTYCNPDYDFPSQSDVIGKTVHLVEDHLKRFPKTLIAVGSYTIGKERIFLAIAEQLDCKIWASVEKSKVLKTLKDAIVEKRLSSMPERSRVHVLEMRKINNKKDLLQYKELFGGAFSHVLAVTPTGWRHERGACSDASLSVMRIKTSGDFSSLDVPYSEHSSYSELRRFVQFLSLKSAEQVIPTVNVGSQQSRASMSKILKSWIEDKRNIKLAMQANANGEGYFNVRFVLPKGKTEATCSELLNDAFEKCKEMELEQSWISSDDALKLKPLKEDVFVLDPFEGIAFDHLRQFKSCLVGPRCIITCITNSEPVPIVPYPVYTAAMTGLVLTSTGFTKEKKSRLQLLTERMGGIFSNAFHDGVTHLVCDVVNSQKYSVALKKNVPIMTEEWVEKVWEVGKHENVKAGDSRFMRFACPALKGLTISISKMSKKDKDNLRKKIEAHGGIYMPTLDMEKTMILVVTSTEGDKYTYARRWQIPCVSPDWVLKSIESGQCLSTTSFLIDKVKSSTPTKRDQTSAGLEEVSMCSTILEPNRSDKTKLVNDTVAPINATVLSGLKNAEDEKNIDSLLEKLDFSRVRKAGPFLEDCCIFLSGFTDAQELHLSRVLNSASATHLNQITSSVTHMVVASFVPEHMRVLKELKISPHLLSLLWITESMLLGRPAEEEDFKICTDINATRITNRQEARNQKPDDTGAVHAVSDEDEKYENDLLALYKTNETKQSDKMSENNTERTFEDDGDLETQIDRFLMDKKLALVGFDEETESDLSDWVTEAGGEIVFRDFDGILDYLVCPPFKMNTDFKATHVVTKSWLDDCLDQGSLVPVSYYHIPIDCEGLENPCEGVVLGITNYLGSERTYLLSLAEALGMVAQEIFAKRDKRDAKKSTHLLCARPEGSKYEAAINWGLPVVSKDWLLACYKDRTWVSEKSFLVGKATVITEGKPEPSCISGLTNDLNSSKKENLDDTEVTWKTPKVDPKMSKLSTIETPALDIDKLKPRPFNLDESQGDSSPSRWMVPSQPSPKTPISVQRKRKRENDNIPYTVRDIKTPNTPYGAFLDKDPSPTTRKVWKKQCMEWSKRQMGQSEREALTNRRQVQRKCSDETEKMELEFQKELLEAERRQLDPEVRSKERQEAMDFLEKKRIPVLEKIEKPFAELMEEKVKKLGLSWKNPGEAKSRDVGQKTNQNYIFKDVVVYVTKKLQPNHSEINAIVASLGGQFRRGYVEDVTHVIFTGQLNDRNKEFRVAKKDKKKIVSPDWVYMSRDEGKRAEEAIFPHTVNLKMSLNLTVDKTPQSKRTRKTSQQEETIITEATKASEKVDQKIEDVDETARAVKLSSNREKATYNSSTNLLKDIAELDELVKDSVENSKRRSGIRLSLDKENAAEIQYEADGTQEGEQQESQGIQWLDPKEEEERIKLQERLANESQSIEDKPIKKNETKDFSAKEEKENIGVTSFNGQGQNVTMDSEEKTMRFMLSSLPEKTRSAFAAFLESNNCEVSNLSTCDPDATHIIAQKLTRSEKILGSIASGKYVLHPSYIDSCLSVGRLLPYERFEWGNPDNGFLLNGEMNSQEMSLAKAAFRWRKDVHEGKRSGAFCGFRAIIHTSEQRKKAFQRLLELGKGKVIAAEPPYTEDVEATHFLAEPHKLPKVTVDWNTLASRGIAAVGPLYINEFLVQDPPPKVDEFLVEEFKPHWKK